MIRPERPWLQKPVKKDRSFPITAVASYGLCVFLVYYGVARIVFQLRHPGATPTEVLMHPIHVLKFDKVPYAEMRK